MFDELSGKLTATLRQLAGRGVLTEDAVREGLRDDRLRQAFEKNPDLTIVHSLMSEV